MKQPEQIHSEEPIYPEGLPTFTLRPIYANGRLWSRSFICPSCGSLCSHGSGDNHVEAHCRCWPDGYFITHDTSNPLLLTKTGLSKLLSDIRRGRVTCL